MVEKQEQIRTIIAAVDPVGGMGKDGKLPWRIPEEMAHFKGTTMGHPVIMGRKTHDSLGTLLAGRHNIVISKQAQHLADDYEFHNPKEQDPNQPKLSFAFSIEEALLLVKDEPQVFIIGGKSIYEQAIPFCNEMLITTVQKQYDCDTFWNPNLDNWTPESFAKHYSEKAKVDFTITTLRRIREDGEKPVDAGE